MAMRGDVLMRKLYSVCLFLKKVDSFQAWIFNIWLSVLKRLTTTTGKY